MGDALVSSEVQLTIKHLFDQKRMRVGHWNATPGFISAASAAIEHHLKLLIKLDMVEVRSLDDPNLRPADVLFISADGIEDEQYPVWLKGISTRIPKAHGIPVPTIIFGNISSAVQSEILRWAVEGNWYFDIVDPGHVSSLTVRVANFLRIHDHLHEIRRMSSASKTLEDKVADMEKQIEQILKGPTKP
jgi:hypothetical protein